MRTSRWQLRWFLATMMMVGWGVLVPDGAYASVNLPLHHWSYEAIERLTAMGIIDRAMVVPKPYSRKQAAKYVARAIERVRAEQVAIDGREKLAEPLLGRLIQLLRPELIELGTIRPSARDTQQTQSTRDASDATTQRRKGYATTL